MKQRAWGIGTFAVAAAIAACSGASSTELFTNPESALSGTEPGASSGDTPGEPGPSTSSSTSSSSSSGSTTSSSSSGSTTSSTSGGPSKDASVPDSPITPSNAKVRCGGTTTCQLPGQICCVNTSSASSECTGQLECNDDDETPIRCDDKSDCLIPGQVCCGSVMGGSAKVECSFNCNSGGGVARARFCDPAAATDECTSVGLTCQASTTFPGYYICK